MILVLVCHKSSMIVSVLLHDHFHERHVDKHTTSKRYHACTYLFSNIDMENVRKQDNSTHHTQYKSKSYCYRHHYQSKRPLSSLDVLYAQSSRFPPVVRYNSKCRNEHMQFRSCRNTSSHGRACPGHPRLPCRSVASKTWKPRDKRGHGAERWFDPIEIQSDRYCAQMAPKMFADQDGKPNDPIG